MMGDVEKQRHARERGDILRTLKEDYQSPMTAMRTLLGALDAQGVSLSQEGLEFHLVYLEQQDYVQVIRAKDLPQRKDRRVKGWIKPETPMFVKLRPKGLQLLDGNIAEDPQVVF